MSVLTTAKGVGGLYKILRVGFDCRLGCRKPRKRCMSAVEVQIVSVDCRKECRRRVEVWSVSFYCRKACRSPAEL